MDDIVTRLRDRAEERQEALDEYWRGHKFDYDFPMLESQAADEIERWRKIATELYTWLLPSDEDDSVREAGLDAMAMYDEAVRGES